MNKIQFERLLKPLVKIYNDIELDIIYNILQRLDSYDGVKGSLEWYLDKLKDLGTLDADSLKVLKKNKKKIKEELLNIVNSSGRNTDNLDQLEEYYKKGLINNNPINIYNSKSINNLINEAFKDSETIMDLINTKALEGTKESYKQILNKAYLETASGVYTYTEAIRRALNEFSNEGIKVATYEGGRALSIESVVRRDVITRMNKLVGDVEIQHCKELETNLIYVDQHLGARVRTEYMKHDYEAHCEWQGKKYMIDGSNDKYANLYEATGYGEMLGLKGINCYHNLRPTWEWEKIPERIDEVENAKAYEMLQEQRKFERKIRNAKIKKAISSISDNPDDRKIANNKLKRLNSDYDAWLEKNDMTRDYNREYVVRKVDDTLGLDSSTINDSNVIKKYEGNIKDKDYFEQIREYEKTIFDKNVEHAIIIEEKGDVYSFIGETNYVNINGNFKNAIITHNHTSIDDEIGGSFGEDDFDLLSRHQDIRELRAVDEKFVYKMKALKKISTTDYNDAYRNAKLIDNDYKHCVMIELKERGLIYYERNVRK